MYMGYLKNNINTGDSRRYYFYYRYENKAFNVLLLNLLLDVCFRNIYS